MKKTLIQFLIAFILCPASLLSQYTPEASAKVYTSDYHYNPAEIRPVKGNKVRNVILMIGDGMGMVHYTAAWVANRGGMNIDKCTYVGLSRTYCADTLITDSGAAGTAMATGKKAKYHSISVDSHGNPLESLTDLAHNKKLLTGIVVTCNLTDATPATFYGNNIDRDDEEEIATDILNCNIDYIFGGGRKQFNQRKDDRNLLNEMKEKGYQVCNSWEETKTITQGKVFAVLEDGQLPLAGERGDLFGKACMSAIELLNQNKKGFFAMFEGSRIDDCGHWNNLPRLIEEVADFDQSIGKVLEWAEKDRRTLVIILADHETGGMTMLNGELKTGQVNANFSTKEHSGILVPVYAYGPGAENFAGIYENTEIFNKICELLNLKD